MDCYRNMGDVRRAFLEFMDRVPFYGMVVACNDDEPLRRLFKLVRPPDGDVRRAKGLRFSRRAYYTRCSRDG